MHIRGADRSASTNSGMKTRLDALMVERGLTTGRDSAKRLIMAGLVFVNNQKADKPGMEFPSDCKLEYRGDTLAYVSRGGLKLEKAIESFGIDLSGKICADIGASTGGFTDCMLQNGAAKIFAIDVGYGQLAWKLREDSRVVVMERRNIRYVTPDQIGEALDFASIDVSFISLALVLPVAFALTRELGEIVCLVKPQFEAGREKVGKKGVVRDIEVHREVLRKVIDFSRVIGLFVRNLTFSPIKGPEGNIEYLLYLAKSANPGDGIDIDNRINAVIGEAGGNL